MPRPGSRRAHASLTSGKDFQSVYRAGSRHISAVATVYVLPQERAQVRLGITTGRKLGRAVDRNLVRRRIREAFRRVQSGLDRGADVVVVPRAHALKAPFNDLVNAIESALELSGRVRSRGAGRDVAHGSGTAKQ